MGRFDRLKRPWAWAKLAGKTAVITVETVVVTQSPMAPPPQPTVAQSGKPTMSQVTRPVQDATAKANAKAAEDDRERRQDQEREKTSRDTSKAKVQESGQEPRRGRRAAPKPTPAAHPATKGDAAGKDRIATVASSRRASRDASARSQGRGK